MCAEFKFYQILIIYIIEILFFGVIVSLILNKIDNKLEKFISTLSMMISILIMFIVYLYYLLENSFNYN